MTDYRQIIEELDRLKYLLQLPEPGLFTWNDAVTAQRLKLVTLLTNPLSDKEQATNLNLIAQEWRKGTNYSEIIETLGESKIVLLKVA